MMMMMMMMMMMIPAVSHAGPLGRLGGHANVDWPGDNHPGDRDGGVVAVDPPQREAQKGEGPRSVSCPYQASRR
jgi:hypothetical protein